LYLTFLFPAEGSANIPPTKQDNSLYRLFFSSYNFKLIPFSYYIYLEQVSVLLAEFLPGFCFGKLLPVVEKNESNFSLHTERKSITRIFLNPISQGQGHILPCFSEGVQFEIFTVYLI
jgi:hypothetical protein